MPRGSILIIEDERDIQDALGELLILEGYDVSHAHDGREALNMLREPSTVPDLILLDLMMPGMSGFDFLKARRDDAKISDIPVVVMTADARPESRLEGWGLKDYLRKPLDIEQLLGIVARYCGSAKR